MELYHSWTWWFFRVGPGTDDWGDVRVVYVDLGFYRIGLSIMKGGETL